MSTTTLPNIPTEVRDALDSYGNLCGDVVAATLDKNSTPLEVADAIAARNRIKDELLVSIERWAMRQIRVTAGLNKQDATSILAELPETDLHYSKSIRHDALNIVATCDAVLEGGAA